MGCWICLFLHLSSTSYVCMYIELYWTETELSKFYLRLVNILWYAVAVAAVIVDGRTSYAENIFMVSGLTAWRNRFIWLRQLDDDRVRHMDCSGQMAQQGRQANRANLGWVGVGVGWGGVSGEWRAWRLTALMSDWLAQMTWQMGWRMLICIGYKYNLMVLLLPAGAGIFIHTCSFACKSSKQLYTIHRA